MKRNRQMAVALCIMGLSFAGLGHGHGGEKPMPPTDRFIQFPDTDEYQTLVVDLHTHSVFSDGHVWPRIRVGEALRDGLDAVAITEHLEYQPHLADIPHPDRNRAYQDALAAAEGTDLMIIAGTEITREAPIGHLNTVFITDANGIFTVTTPPADASDVRAYFESANQWPAEEAVEAANKQGGFVFWNHPFWPAIYPNGLARMETFHSQMIEKGQLHGIEIVNGDTYSEEAHQMALDHELTLIGVSDVHDLIDWDYQPELGGHRPVTLVLATERSADALKAGLFAGRTVVWFKNMLIGNEANLVPLLRSILDVESAAYRRDLDIIDIVVSNDSDATIQMKNLSPYTFEHSGDYLEIPPHGTTSFSIKAPTRLTEVTIDFEILNALTAPKTHPRLTHKITLPEDQVAR
ncbi:MAG: Sb-PDE family phosphodiesterase [Proteobacteria bacterium]|nr:Sb-PDE family phosphodiesterase [Pseudomonadota bacterium]